MANMLGHWQVVDWIRTISGIMGGHDGPNSIRQAPYL